MKNMACFGSDISTKDPSKKGKMNEMIKVFDATVYGIREQRVRVSIN